ncbi:MAG: hypothetical protein HY908_21950 [Myxococcales bacterium]|nr:hypothetical protein [Myxococcales bacterium]
MSTRGAPPHPSRLLVLGTGYVGTAVARLGRARGMAVTASARRSDHAVRLRAEGFEVHEAARLGAEVGALVDARTHVVVAFPPDGETDLRVAAALGAAAAVSYVSTTGVYGATRGLVDDATPVPPPADARTASVLAAERAYRSVGGTVLRCPGIYGPDRGLHVRVVSGTHRIPGDGSLYLSRIHVADLAALLLASARVRGECFVVGDLAPAPQLEVVRFIVEQHGVPMPASVPEAEVHPSLRTDRRIDGRRALAVLGVELAFPTYRAGMAPSF